MPLEAIVVRAEIWIVLRDKVVASFHAANASQDTTGTELGTGRPYPIISGLSDDIVHASGVHSDDLEKAGPLTDLAVL